MFVLYDIAHGFNHFHDKNTETEMCVRIQRIVADIGHVYFIINHFLKRNRLFSFPESACRRQDYEGSEDLNKRIKMYLMCG